MVRYQVLKIGKALHLDDFQATAAPRRPRPLNPRDEDLKLLVREVSVGAASQVVPWLLGDEKPGTARAAAQRVIRQLGLAVHVGSHRAHPGILFFSRQPIRNRSGRAA